MPTFDKFYVGPIGADTLDLSNWTEIGYTSTDNVFSVAGEAELDGVDVRLLRDWNAEATFTLDWVNPGFSFMVDMVPWIRHQHRISKMHKDYRRKTRRRNRRRK